MGRRVLCVEEEEGTCHVTLTHPNNENQVFQPPPWPQVDKKHLDLQTVFTNIRKEECQELSEFHSGAVTGSSSTVGCIIRTWKRLGRTATQPLRGRLCKLTERSDDAEATFSHYRPPDFLCLQISLSTAQSFMERVSMAAAASIQDITKCNAERRTRV